LTTSPGAVLTGAQTPSHQLVPASRSSAGQEAVELAASAGLVLDPWEALVLERALGEREDGSWAALEVGLVVPRRNGKGAILEARELAGLYLFKEELILHSAHEFKTAAEAFRRLLILVQNTPDLERRVQRVRTSHGEEGLELKGGHRLRFLARSTGSGRGFGGDTVILDEAYHLPATAVSALLPTMAAQRNPQLWYASSAPLPREESDTLRRLCRRGRGGEASRLAYFEWCARAADDPGALAQANPALGIRITEEFVETERGAMSEEDFNRERLGIYPEVVEAAEPPAIAEEDWRRCADSSSKALDPVVLAFEVSTDRAWSTIAAAGRSPQGGTHVEVVERRAGTGWVVERLVELRARHRPSAICCNPAGPAGALSAACARAGIELGPVSGRELAQACGAAYDDVTEGRWRHIDQPDLNAAVTGAMKRSVGDVWIFDRRTAVDISPLLAVAIAAFAAHPPTDEFVAFTV
jgi:hypothetical protein